MLRPLAVFAFAVTATAAQTAPAVPQFVGCIPVRVMLVIALGSYRTGQIEDDWNSHGLPLEVEGGPSWIGSDQYIVEAKTSANVPKSVLQGPMLRAILEDRFQLKTHRETRDVPVYELTVAKGGLKLQRPGDLACTEPLFGGPPREGRSFLPLNCSKLQRTEPGSCVEREPGPAQPGEKPRCGDSPGLIGPQRITYDVFGGAMKQVAGALRVDKHPVIDKTGLADLFNVHLEYTPDNAPPTDNPDGAPTIFTALAQLGLKLDPSHASRDFLVIDRLERPTGN
jgi:uncharacterized protein (TIGR03435 family)